MTGSSGAARIGLVSDSPLHLYAMQNLVRDFGYELVSACTPEKLGPDAVARALADVWMICLSEHCDGEALISMLLDEVDVPVLLDEVGGHSNTDVAFARWQHRVGKKLQRTTAARALAPRAAAVSENPVLASATNKSRQREVASDVWVLGASLGGPEAMLQFIAEIPAGLPISFVYAQHIDANCAGLLARVLERKSALRVRVLGDGSVLSRGLLGIVPVGSELEFLPLGRVRTTGKPWSGAYAPAIDDVIKGIAGKYRRSAGVIIFSGMGDDGAAGCAAMQSQGGSVWVQSPESCVCAAMPEATIARVRVASTDTPAGLARALLRQYQWHDRNSDD